MLKRRAKESIKHLIARTGYELVPRHFPPGDRMRPVGSLRSFLEDVRARGFYPECILDVGVWRATWSSTARDVFPDAQFYLIDPLNEHPESVDAFLHRTPNARFLQVAAGPEDGQRSFHRHAHSSFSGSSFYRPDVGSDNKGELIDVPMKRIDTLLKEGAMSMVPVLVKLDVQGFELELLQGASRLLGSTEMFILEVSLMKMHGPDTPLLEDVVSYFCDRGYAAYDFPGFHRRPRDGALIQADVAFVKRDSVLRGYQGFE